MKKWKEAGMIIIPVVPSVAFAKRLERSGADALVVEGTEAGGHIGEITTMTLVPQVCDAVNIPVIAAGGIADHRGFDAAYVLGARGVQVGTVLLASKECPIHDNYKDKVIQAKDTSTVVTGRQSGAPVRVLKNKMAREYLNLTKYGDAKLEDLEKLTLGSLRRAVFDGDIDGGSFMAGQSAGLVHEVRTVEDILKDICENSLVFKGVIQ
jgi:enoyl-[acyl-carrier protein] reductase II